MGRPGPTRRLCAGRPSGRSSSGADAQAGREQLVERREGGVRGIHAIEVVVQISGKSLGGCVRPIVGGQGLARRVAARASPSATCVVKTASLCGVGEARGPRQSAPRCPSPRSSLGQGLARGVRRASISSSVRFRLTRALSGGSLGNRVSGPAPPHEQRGNLRCATSAPCTLPLAA